MDNALPSGGRDRRFESYRGHVDIPTYVFIDDERRLPEGLKRISEAGTGHVFVYRNSADALLVLKEFAESRVKVDELWLDHDLGRLETAPYGWDSIMPVVYWLEETAISGIGPDIGTILVHTSNPPAGEQMMAILRPHYSVFRIALSAFL